MKKPKRLPEHMIVAHSDHRTELMLCPLLDSSNHPAHLTQRSGCLWISASVHLHHAEVLIELDILIESRMLGFMKPASKIKSHTLTDPTSLQSYAYSSKKWPYNVASRSAL